MPTFKQTFLRPGRYHLGGGLFRDVTREDIAGYIGGTKALLASGNGVPILFEHAAPGSADGAPVQLSTARDRRAAQVKHGAGWLKSVEQDKDGNAVHVLDVRDKTAAKGLKNGTIKFTSPELRENWTDGKGRSFAKIISHVALTHKPRNPDQSAITEVASGTPAAALQFSLADWQQFSDDDEEVNDGGPDGRTPAPDSPDDGQAENPDAPKSEDEDAATIAQFQALLEHLAADGLDLTSDTTPETLVRDLLIAYKTKTAMKAMADEDDDEDDDLDDDDKPDEAPVSEEKPPVQFSLADVDDPATNIPRLLGLVMRGRHDQLVAQATAGQRDGQFPPALVTRLTDLAGSMQFSAEADEQAALSVGDVVTMLRETLPKQVYTHWTADQFSAATEALPPSNLTTPDGEFADLTPEQARAFVDAQAKFIPGLASKK